MTYGSMRMSEDYFGAPIDSIVPGFRNVSSNYKMNIPRSNVMDKMQYTADTHGRNGGCC